jgi:predicted Zn-dependent protease
MRLMRLGSAGLAVVLAAACATNPATGNKEFSLMSEAQEIELGQQMDAQVREEMGVYNDPELQRYVQDVGTRLARSSDRPNLPWHFAVVDSPAVNAFALPGGYIYLTRGIMPFLDDEAELAGVLGHEIGHVTRRHSVQQMQQAQGANVGLTMACTLTRVCNSGASQAAINVGGTALFAKFSRSDEREADAEAVTTTIKAGISPLGIPVMFQTLLNERKTNPSRIEGWFSTHPMEESRITNTQNQINQYSPGEIQGLTRDTQEFQNFKRRLMSLPAPRK